MKSAVLRTELNVERIRADFPVLHQTIHGKPLVFLDSAASSQKPIPVLEVMNEYYRTTHANVHRGVYQLSEQATALYEEARRKIAAFIGAASPKEIIFTRNATEAINLVAYAWARPFLQEGDEILLTEMEHHSNLVPWFLVAQEKGVRIRYIPITDEGHLRLDLLDALITERTRLVAVTMMSNVLGTINPLQPIIQKAHAAGAIVLIDGAQGVPHIPVNVQELGCDFLAFSGHKMCGPTGIGVLWGRRELLEAMPPFLGGGDMIRRVTFEGAEWNELPYKFEAGTPAIAEAIGLGAAVDYLSCLGMEAIHRHEQVLVAYAIERLSEFPGIRIVGPPPAERGGVVSFVMDRVHPHDIATILDREGICIRAGHHCAMPLHERLGLTATARASFYLYNTIEEVDQLLEGLEIVRRTFHRAG
ncbi:MAG: cysteine desulfurase [Anaerolineae bacterium]|nr:cysteine desulfurase [Thermoflexus sp.]MDW8065075.1 cysteine desulfurase [Anaerolineae bacterium]